MTNNDGIGNGSIPLRIGRLIDTTVYGGPYREFGSWEHPRPMFGVKMAVEIKAPCHVDIPTKDFCVPKVSDLKAGIVKALMAMINEEDVYVGCMGGIGRTGIFLAALAKVQSEFRKRKHRAGRGEDPVLYVRKHFIPHAVETAEQEKYIADLDVSDIVQWLGMTQIAMGMGGLTPAGVTAGQTVRTAGPVELNRIRDPWIAEEDKIDNPAFDDRHRESWKEDAAVRTLHAEVGDMLEFHEFPDTDSADPVNLQEQIWKLEEKLEKLGTVVSGQVHVVSVLNTRVSNSSNMFTTLQNMVEKHLTKPSIRARIRTWWKDN